MIGRGTGKTLAMVKALPEEGAVVIVHSAVMRDYVLRMIHDVRGDAVRKACKIVVIQRHADLGYLECLRRETFVDHAFYETCLDFHLGDKLKVLVDQINVRLPRRAP